MEYEHIQKPTHIFIYFFQLSPALSFSVEVVHTAKQLYISVMDKG